MHENAAFCLTLNFRNHVFIGNVETNKLWHSISKMRSNWHDLLQNTQLDFKHTDTHYGKHLQSDIDITTDTQRLSPHPRVHTGARSCAKIHSWIFCRTSRKQPVSALLPHGLQPPTALTANNGISYLTIRLAKQLWTAQMSFQVHYWPQHVKHLLMSTCSIVNRW